jgi:hypothetical protein
MGVSDAAMRLYDVGRNAVQGNFQPLKEQAEGAGRGLLKIASAFDPVNADETYAAVSAEQDPALAAIERRRAERLRNDPYTQASNTVNEQLAREAAAQPGFAGSVTRGVTSGAVQALPYLAASAASGGSLPVLAGTAAAQSDFVHPEQAALNIAGATLPIKASRALTPTVERVAGALPGRLLPAAARAAGPIGVGAGTNVATAALAGERDPAKLAEQAAVGGILSGGDALSAARGGRATVTEPTSPTEQATNSRSPIAPPIEIRASGPAAEEAAIRARLGLAEPTKSSQIDQLFGEFTGNAPGETVTHPNPDIHGKQIIAQTNDGRVVVENANNKSGVSIVKNREAQPTPNVEEPAQLGNPEALARAIGTDPGDHRNVTAESLGLEVKPQPNIPANATPRQQMVDINSITLTRDTLNRGRMVSVRDALAEGVKPEKKGVPLRQQIDPIELTPDPNAPGRFLVSGDGNHRTAFLRLSGAEGQIPAKVFATPEQRAQMRQAANVPRTVGEGVTPEFHQAARRRALAMAGLSPEQIEAEMGNLPPLQAFETAPTKAVAPTPQETPKSKGTVLGSGLGSLQPMLENVKLPSRAEIAETAGGVQAASQLGNPRFVIRNVLQHVIYGKQERAATRLAAALDWAYSKASGTPRQISAPRGSDLASYVRNWGKAVQAYKAGQPLPGKPNADYLVADGNKLSRGVGKVMTWINEIPDAANWQTRFESSLQSIMNARKRSSAPLDVDGAIDQAMLEANHAALRDRNFASTAMQKFKQGLNSLSKPIFGTDRFGAGDFILKYAQTPGALFKRGLERSPLGLFQVAKEAATPGPFRRRNTLLALSRVAEGAVTGPALGAALAAGGILVGPEEENKTGQGFEREQGVRGYSLNGSALVRFLTGGSTALQPGDKLYSIDWAQPWAMNVSVGAALMNLHKQGKLGATSGAEASGEAIYNSLAKTLDIMGDQSVLKSLSRYMSRATGDTFSDRMLSFMKAVGLDIPSSFVPSSARMVRQVIDPYERDTRPEQRGGFNGFAEEATNRALAQLPGVSHRFPTRPSLLTGQDQKTPLGEMGVPSRIAAQFSPSNISTYAPSDVAKEISRLNRTGAKISVPFPNPITDKETGKRESTPDLRARERQFAQEFARASKDLIDSPDYILADDADKATAFNALVRRLHARTRNADLDEPTPEGLIQRAETNRNRREAAAALR